MNTQHVSIALGERSYSILIGAGLLDCADAFGATPEAAGNGRALIVSNETVAPKSWLAYNPDSDTRLARDSFQI